MQADNVSSHSTILVLSATPHKLWEFANDLLPNVNSLGVRESCDAVSRSWLSVAVALQPAFGFRRV